MEPYTPQCGDLGFTGSPGAKLSRAISYYETGKNELPAVATHEFIVCRGKNVVEAGAGKGANTTIRPWKERVWECSDKGSHIIVFRPPLTFIQQEVIQETAVKLNGTRYAFGEIILQAIDGRLRKLGWLKEGVPWAAKLGRLLPGTMICSGVANTCLCNAQVLPDRFRYLTPDCTFDEAVARRWPVVYMNEDGVEYWRQGTKERTK